MYKLPKLTLIFCLMNNEFRNFLFLYFRFGVVFVVDGDIQDKAEDNIGAALVRAFSFIKADKDIKAAFKFITKVILFCSFKSLK